MLQINNICTNYGAIEALRGVNLEANDGEITCLLGPNGAGKTSLLKCLLGLLKPDSGAISLDGKALPVWTRSEVARRLGYLPQGAPCHWPMTAARIVGLGLLPHASTMKKNNHTIGFI